MNMLIFLFNFFIGSCLASHACLIYDRYDTKDFFFSRSHCISCNNTLTLTEEIPIFSFLYLKGKCRYCHNDISKSLFLFELLGGCSFCNNNFFTINDIGNIIFIFFFLLITIFDFHDQEFPTELLLPPIYLSIICFKGSYSLFLLEVLPIVLIFIISILQKKMGTGDLYLYLVIALKYSPSFANLIFLIASFYFLIYFALENKLHSKAKIAFIPFIYLAFITLKQII